MVPDRMVSFSMTFSDPYPAFQGHGIFEVGYLKNKVFEISDMDKVTKEH